MNYKKILFMFCIAILLCTGVLAAECGTKTVGKTATNLGTCKLNEKCIDNKCIVEKTKVDKVCCQKLMYTTGRNISNANIKATFQLKTSIACKASKGSIISIGRCAARTQSVEDIETITETPLTSGSADVVDEVKVMGLQNAIMRVRKQEHRAHLITVLDKITDKRKEKLNNMTVVFETDDNGKITAIGMTEAKFLGIIPTSKIINYEVNDDGTIVHTKKGLDFLFIFTPEDTIV